MKYVFLVFMSALLVVSCDEIQDKKAPEAKKEAAGATNEVTTEDPASFTTIEWLDTEKDFGKINEGQQLEVSFRFKNTGDKPLVIRSVRPGCGCTVADPPKEPIAPGAEGVIKGSFNSQGREGMNHKEIYVDANTKEAQNHVLKFTVEVVKSKS
jgi:hypothetical protein